MTGKKEVLDNEVGNTAVQATFPCPFIHGEFYTL